MEGFESKQIITDPDLGGLITYRPDPLQNTEDAIISLCVISGGEPSLQQPHP
jgi:hypothetical protein